ncbi:MAG: Holliday junction resolvase RuvX, partial [Lachnospiraceae bacterium]|nr:Holliday junction resolvase RuvX [Lachnospiraceae bacterium]
MGLDHGAHTVGVSLSDELFLTAQPAEIIRRERESAIRGTLQRIETLVKERGVCRIVVGLPLNMDGSETERAEAARRFGEKLQRRLEIP